MSDPQKLVFTPLGFFKLFIIGNSGITNIFLSYSTVTDWIELMKYVELINKTIDKVFFIQFNLKVV